MINLFFTCIWDFYILIGVEYLMPPPYKRISSFHLLITGLALLINHTPKSKPQNFASRKFHKILDDHIIFHKTRGGSTSAPSFSASFCSLCTWSKVVILIEALAEIQKMWNCAIGCPEKPKKNSHPVPLSMASPKHPLVEQTLVSHEYHFGRVLGKFWKSHILGSFLADFPL